MPARRTPSWLALVVVAAVSAAGRSAHGAAFTAGNLVVYRVGDGGSALTNAATPVFLEERTAFDGSLAQSPIAMPTAVILANRRLTSAGTSTSEGFLTFSPDGAYLVLTGYDAPLGTANVSGTTSTSVNRVVGRVTRADGTVDTSTALTDTANMGNVRGAATTNGSEFWVSGGAGGIRYATLGSNSSTQVTSNPTNLRAVEVAGGQLYASSASGSFRVATVGTGLPTTSGQIVTNLPGLAGSNSPYAFFLADLSGAVPGFDTLYVADDSIQASNGGIQKYSLVGGTWTATGTVFVTGNVRGLTGIVSGGNVVLYATTASMLVSLPDSSGYNGTLSGSVTLLQAAGTNTAYRGVALVPQPPPSVVSVTRANPSPTNASAADFTVTFNQAVTGVDAGDFSLSTTGVSGSSVLLVNGSGTTYTVTVGTGTGDGTIRLDVVDDDSVVNAGGLPLGGTGVGNGGYTSGQVYAVDKTPPTVASITRATSSPTTAASVSFVVTFSEAVTGVDPADFALTTTGLTGASVASVLGCPVMTPSTSCVVNVTTGTATGCASARLDLADDDTIVDTAANALGGAGAGNGNFTSGESYTIDRENPSVAPPTASTVTQTLCQ